MNEMNEDVSRRKFLWTLLIGLGGILSTLIGIPVAGFVVSPSFKKKESRWVPVAWLEDLKSQGPQEIQFAYFKQDAWLHQNARQLVYVLRSEADKFTVFSGTCTHLGCAVRWDSNKNKFLCPCHGGQFDVNGNVVGGPPPKPLVKLETKIENGRLFVKEP